MPITERKSLIPTMPATMLIASVLIQMATNLFNDFFDYKRGIDNKESVGKSTALITGDVTPSRLSLWLWPSLQLRDSWGFISLCELV